MDAIPVSCMSFRHMMGCNMSKSNFATHGAHSAMLTANVLLISTLCFSMTGVGGRPELIILGSNSIDGPWEVGLTAFQNTTLFCPKIRRFIS